MDIYQWAQEADVGTRVVYAERSAESERFMDGRCLSAALKASNEGLVFLAQRRVRRHKEEGGIFRYEATRISRPTAQMLGLVDKPL